MSAFTSSAAAAPAAGVVNRIQAKLPDMPAAMAKIGSYLLEHPQAPLELSIMELAEQTKTSPATVTRFCRLLGYAGYVPFRVSIASDLGRSDARESWKADIGRAFGPDDSPRDVLSTLVNAHTRSLTETAAVIDLAQMNKVARRIAMCQHVDIYGIGGSSVMAKELQSRLYRIGINAHYWAEVHAGLTSAAIQDSNSVAIGISNTGRTEETLQMLREAGEAGALTVALSNNPGSPLAESADESIITSVHEQFLQPDDLSAKHVQLLVLDLIYLLVAQVNFAQTTSKLAASAMAVSPHRRPTRAARLEVGTGRGSRNSGKVDDRA
ncbi:DNA-binding MurR/RpiR family transcriptional regulator [Arthrobacter stackebrandtii]|uniref:DNA-binding MurR/RpiR family transcriptional regulator n=1 Tax=Arthrobacter stackebrandtii TaxID=272161 RepID=A0ABS4YV13_9MICC|nr:MurR/RpiR family transcriptional regulator [Arthrobacter stackebrandtii]MBP2412645.1 DNA-binding MurR/RpiR family transcriptional regulator [Arthrobacter stackebrandtii]PYG98803.1 MurR/RpiR family transcriptional regulator [Arthrobacter stackebrandtii]